MSRTKVNTFFIFTFVIVLSLLIAQTSIAQIIPALEIIFPQRGAPGQVINLLLKGSDFESISELNGVLLTGQELPVFDFNILSDQLIEVLVLIPEDIPTGPTEISFIFDGIGMDAFFIVTEPGEQELAPILNSIKPQEGRVDTEETLFVEFSSFLDSELGEVIIGGVEMPILEYAVNETGEAWRIRIYLPAETPIGETEIGLYYQDFSFRDYFFVQGPDFDQPVESLIYGFSPKEGRIGTEIELYLEGENLLGLGELVGMTIAGMDVQILYYTNESNEISVAGVYLPPELPAGETEIVFFFENFGHEDRFFVDRREPGTDFGDRPTLWNISPQEGEIDSEIELLLEGDNLFELGDLISVAIGGLDIPVFDNEILSNETVLINVFLPEETHLGRQTIIIAFENSEFSESFEVTEPIQTDFPTDILLIIGISIVVGAAIIGGGILVTRSIKGRSSQKEKPDEHPEEPEPLIDFKVGMDYGNQSVEPTESSLTIDLHFDIEMDFGEQSIETDNDGLLDNN